MGKAQIVSLGITGVLAFTPLAPIGGIIGPIVGNLLFPPDDLRSEGPRLGDLQVSSSAYGAPRAIGFGTMRMGGNVIWSSGIREQKNTTTISGGKGLSGPDTRSTTYSYFGSWAQAFGEGPAIDVLRMWADGKLIYDKRSVSTATQKEGLRFRFYTGGEDQLPDPAIEADTGIGTTPAFRGTVYILFDDVPLIDFGNRIPNITAEITYDATAARLSEISTDLVTTETSGWSGQIIGADFNNGFIYTIDATGTPENTWLRKFRLTDLQEVAQINGPDGLSQAQASGWGGSGGVIIPTPSGDLVSVAAVTGFSNSLPIVLIDGVTLKEKDRFGTGNGGVDMDSNGFEACDKMAMLSLYGPTGRKDYVMCGSILASVGILEVGSNTLTYLFDTDTFNVGITGNRVISVIPGKVTEFEGQGYFSTHTSILPSATAIQLFQVTVSASAVAGMSGGVDVVSGVDTRLIREFLVTDLFPSASNYSNTSGQLFYDVTDDTVIMYAISDDAPTEARLFKIDPVDGSLLWTSDDIASGVRLTESRGGAQAKIRNNTLGWVELDGGFQIDTVTGTIIENDDMGNFTNTTATSSPGIYDSLTETYTVPAALGESTPVARFFFNRKDSNEVSIGAIVRAIATKTGLVPATDMDTTGIDATTTPGYLLGRQVTGRTAIQPLAQVYFFDGFESDYKLKFVLRGGASVRTIPQADFAPLAKEGQIISENRTQEVELPERMSVLYMDEAKDYQSNAQHTKRIKGPTPAMRSDNQQSVEYSGSLVGTFAKQQSEKLLYTAWTERSQFQIKVPWTHLDLDPSDVVTLSLENGQNLRSRLVQADIGADLPIEMVAVGEEVQQFLSVVTGDSGSGQPVQSLPATNFVKAILMDLPLLRDANEPASRATNPLYVVMGSSYEGSFRAGTLHKSSDGGVSFTEENSFVSEMNFGTIIDTLGDPPTNNFATDTVNSFTVQMSAGGASLVSVTQLQMLNGANGAAIFKANGEVEVIQFRTVVTNADGTFTISNLLRGRRGTDTMAYNHTAFETFVFLEVNDIEVMQLSLGERNSALTYRAVGTGQLFDNGETQVFTSLHRALMPYAPVHATMADGASSSTDFAWVRRTRVGGAWQDSVGEVPLSEDSEEYELEIFDMPGGSVVRTVLGLSTPAYNYTSANQTSDGFSPPIQTATIKVYQISAQVGRGFSEEVTINV